MEIIINVHHKINLYRKDHRYYFLGNLPCFLHHNHHLMQNKLDTILDTDSSIEKLYDYYRLYDIK